MPKVKLDREAFELLVDDALKDIKQMLLEHWDTKHGK